jgi:hypothetical protein
VTLLGKCVVGGLTAAAVLGAAVAYWRGTGGRAVMGAEHAAAMVVAIAALAGFIAFMMRFSARGHAEDNATVEASNAALRSIAASTGLSYRETPSYEHSIAGRFVQPATLSGTYRGVVLKVSSNGSYTAVIVPAFPASAGTAMRAAMGWKVRLGWKAWLRVKVPASPPSALSGGLPSGLVQRLKSRALDIILDEDGLMFRVEPGRRPPFWKVEGEDPNRLETDPVRLQAILEDVCELARLAGATGVQDRPLSDLERRAADLERRIAERKGGKR